MDSATPGRRLGAFASRQDWLKYGGLLVLAIVAFGVAAIALMGPRTPEGTAPVPVSPSRSPSASASEPPSAAAPPAIGAPSPTGTATPQPPGIQLPAEPVLLILGDSYTAGVGADRPDQGWAYLVAKELGYAADVDGVGGTGFAWGGGAQDERGEEYEVRLRRIAGNPALVPNVLVLQGGQNDSQSSDVKEVEAATTQTIEAARRFWPGIQVVVLGPSAPQPLAEELRGVNSAVRAGAAAANAPFIDAVEGNWFTSANSPGFDADGAHPNTAGHAYLARKFLESWASLTR
ncbi:SGNH/GDSL hydrolase family protein [Arthrobacter sp. BB-1]|uniref:SGNH/GDSL hydrolase family protein n=1 Tax=unclassified Arthrobacter TaxID=235627 RepID=UPI0011129D4C|nr:MULTISPECIES: SGNH/GDSL hydrolase family protein [unclassified Arthrobacter]TNB70485.1 SGNH/GDSL hydrolase family protein [Arthrobacter sp. BB-1]